MWCRVFRQKQAHLSVCKAWYSVGLPFLYEHIHVRFIPQLMRLLETLWNTGQDFRRFVKSISFYCIIPTSYAERFKDKLKLFFSLCPNAKAFSYLSSCPLPSVTYLGVLPAHITHLCFGNNISCEALMNTLKIASQNLVSLSFVSPDRPAGLSNLDMKSNDSIQFPDLEILSCERRHGTMFLNNVAASWSMPRIKRLTLRCPYDVGREVANFCQQHGAGLTFFNMVPSYICDSWKDPFTDLGDVLDLCPALEHIVIHPRAVGYLNHPRIRSDSVSGSEISDSLSLIDWELLPRQNLPRSRSFLHNYFFHPNRF